MKFRYSIIALLIAAFAIDADAQRNARPRPRGQAQTGGTGGGGGTTTTPGGMTEAEVEQLINDILAGKITEARAKAKLATVKDLDLYKEIQAAMEAKYVQKSDLTDYEANAGGSAISASKSAAAASGYASTAEQKAREASSSAEEADTSAKTAAGSAVAAAASAALAATAAASGADKAKEEALKNYAQAVSKACSSISYDDAEKLAHQARGMVTATKWTGYGAATATTAGVITGGANIASGGGFFDTSSKGNEVKTIQRSDKGAVQTANAIIGGVAKAGQVASVAGSVGSAGYATGAKHLVSKLTGQLARCKAAVDANSTLDDRVNNMRAQCNALNASDLAEVDRLTTWIIASSAVSGTVAAAGTAHSFGIIGDKVGEGAEHENRAWRENRSNSAVGIATSATTATVAFAWTKRDAEKVQERAGKFRDQLKLCHEAAKTAAARF